MTHKTREAMDAQQKAEMDSKNGLLFDQISRQIILEFYEKSKTKSKTWIWWHRNSIVTQFEVLKAQRDFDKAMNKAFKESLLFKLITKTYDTRRKTIIDKRAN